MASIFSQLLLDHEKIVSLLAIMVTFIAFLPYIQSILQGKTKPHVFSWIIWGTTTFIVFLAQLEDQGGAGAWPMGVSAIVTIYIAGLAYTKKADISITKSDWLFLISALSAIPCWYWTNDPLWAVIILTSVDLVGFIPTYCKAYKKPFEEKLSLFIIITIRNILAIIALEHKTLTTIMFPAGMSIACVIFIGLVWLRRFHLKKQYPQNKY